jgi:DNA invertase Pin-like site-specific DNA recombinase
MARVLGAARESGRGETSVSIENQEQRIRQWADDHGHTVVHITVDKATSGGTPARERENLGPWLRDFGKLDSWDILACAKLDRGFRSVIDFAGTQEWAEKQGKSLVSVAEGYDFTTPEGRLMAIQLVAFAEFERKRAGQRRGEAKNYKRDTGMWDGGRLPYGYAPAGSNGNWRLVQDATTAPVVRRMITDSLAGESLRGIAAALNAEGVLSPLGRQWRDTAVRRILASPALMGHTTKMRGSVVTTRRDRDGQPILFTNEPLVIPEVWRDLQASLDSRARTRGERQARHLLWDVAFCPKCQGRLYGHRQVKRPEKGSYYSCKTCPKTHKPLVQFESDVIAKMLSSYGGQTMLTRELVRGDDHAGEISRLEQRAERWRADLADEYDDALASALAALESRLRELRETRTPDREEWALSPTGETVADHWASLATVEERNKFLREFEGMTTWMPDGTVRFLFPVLESDDLRMF